jgi:hypothetical protein
MKICTFWDITPWSSFKINRCFGRKYCHLLHAGFSLGLFFYPEDRCDMFIISTDYMPLYRTPKCCWFIRKSYGRIRRYPCRSFRITGFRHMGIAKPSLPRRNLLSVSTKSCYISILFTIFTVFLSMSGKIMAHEDVVVEWIDSTFPELVHFRFDSSCSEKHSQTAHQPHVLWLCKKNYSAGKTQFAVNVYLQADHSGLTV